MFVTVIPTGEGKDRPSLSPIPVAYVCVFCICIYVDKNFVINNAFIERAAQLWVNLNCLPNNCNLETMSFQDSFSTIK